jgi:hypothetical protein
MSDAPLAFISSRHWRYAHTMPDWPHEYTVKAWRHDETEEFVAFCQLIDGHGIVEPWPPPPAIPRYHTTTTWSSGDTSIGRWGRGVISIPPRR